MRELQKRNIIAALDATNWKVSGKDGTAELLGVRPTTLYDRLKAFGIKKPGS
jgi:transcriptional regulator of acetoin/glycerol metabolism